MSMNDDITILESLENIKKHLDVHRTYVKQLTVSFEGVAGLLDNIIDYQRKKLEVEARYWNQQADLQKESEVENAEQ